MKKFLIILATLGVALTTYTGVAKADNSFSLHLEPGVAVPLTAPQDNIYHTGGVLTAKGMFAVLPYLSIGPSISNSYLPRAVDDGLNAGTMWQFDGSVRLQGDRRQFATGLFHTLNPWLDLDFGAAQTGNLSRPVWDVGVGAEVPLDQNRIFWLGPFVRYTHAFQTADTQDATQLDHRDVNLLQAGLSFSFDAPTTRKVDVVDHHHTVYAEREVPATCPPPPPPVVTAPAPEKLEVVQVVYFDHDSAALRWESRDKLDAVVTQLKAHPNLVVSVEGHASSDGDKLHNVKLSGERTTAVQMYIIKHGVSPAQLRGIARGIDFPSAPNSTKEGRERNRRVEFTVTFTSVSK